MNSTIPTRLRDSFWEAIDYQLDMIEAAKPTTSAEVLRLLDGSAKVGFFGGGSDRQLLDSLSVAGWEVTDFHAIYYWTAQHPATGHSLEYIEGDVYDRTDG